MKVWNADSGAELATYEGRRPTRPAGPSMALAGATMFAITMLPDSRTALSHFFGAGVVWDLDSGREIRKVETGLGVFSPDFRRLCGSGETLKVLDFESGVVISTPRGHSGRGQPSSFSPDGRRLWTSSTDGTAKLWDADTGRELLTLKTGMGMEARPMFSADGQKVLVVANGRAQLLPAQTWK
jgi:WD40 repeat protein